MAWPIGETIFFDAVRVKSFDAILTRTLVEARNQLRSNPAARPDPRPDEEFGLIVPKGKGQVLDSNVRKLLDENDGLARIILPLLEA
ncbi:hypothetical protein GGE67_004153 [Rhizobium leucaenae]|nr:hypothetical protein [Rhizobium leucaenae]